MFKIVFVLYPRYTLSGNNSEKELIRPYISETIAFILSRFSQIERETKKLLFALMNLSMIAIRGAGYIQAIFNLLPQAREHLWSHQCYHFHDSAT